MNPTVSHIKRTYVPNKHLEWWTTNNNGKALLPADIRLTLVKRLCNPKQ